jgi:sugar lactone lactonase YvrE
MISALVPVFVALALAPAAPSIAGNDRPVAGTAHTYVFTSAEKGVKTFRYRCSLDSPALHACTRHVTFRFAAGMHVLRAQAVDPAGRRSPVSRLTIFASVSVPQLAVRDAWHVNVSGNNSVFALYGVSLGPDGNLYVSDAVGDRVAVYDQAGTLLRRFGSAGAGPGQFQFELNPDPRDATIPFSAIAVAPSGAVYVSQSQRVQRFDAAGAYQLGWGTVGTGNGQFTRITDLTVGPNGNVYVLEDRPDRLGRVQVFDPAGTFLTTFARGQIIDSGGIALDGAGNVLVADDHANTIKVFAPDGRLLRSFGEGGSAPGQLDFPTEMAVSGSTLYVCDSDHRRIVRFDLGTGKPTGWWPVTTTRIPDAIAVDAAGAVYVITDDGLLTKYAIG